MRSNIVPTRSNKNNFLLFEFLLEKQYVIENGLAIGLHQLIDLPQHSIGLLSDAGG